MADAKRSVGRLLLIGGGVWFALAILANAGLLGSGSLASFFAGAVFLPIVLLFLGRAITRAQRSDRSSSGSENVGRTPPSVPGRPTPAPAGPARRPVTADPAKQRPVARPVESPFTTPEEPGTSKEMPTPPAIPQPLPLTGERRMTSAEMIEQAKKRYSRPV